MPFVIVFATGMIGMSIVGAVLATRAPHSSIGWLFQGAAGTLAIAIVAQEYALRAATNLPGLPAGPYVAALNPGLFPYSVGAIATILLVFPQGRLLSHRWRVLVWIIWAGAAAGSLSDVLGLETFDDFSEGIRIANPLSVGSEAAWRPVSGIGFGALLAGAIVALGSVLLRYRRAEGEERQQVRQLAWAAAPGCRAWRTAWRRSADRCRWPRSRAPAPRSAAACRWARSQPVVAASQAASRRSGPNADFGM